MKGTQAQKNLLPQDIEELKVFRTEAEAELQAVRNQELADKCAKP